MLGIDTPHKPVEGKFAAEILIRDRKMQNKRNRAHQMVSPIFIC